MTNVVEPRDVRLSDIRVVETRRPVGDISSLADSMSRLGLLNPVLLREDLRLIAGHRRLFTARQLGWETVPALVLSLDDVDARIAEIDENLVRLELTVLERAEQLAERKQLHEARHPETRHGGDRRSSRKDCDLKPERFTAGEAKRTSRKERAVQLDVRIAERIAPEVRDALRETPAADDQTELLRITRMPEDEQLEVAERLATGSAKTVTDAHRQLRQEQLRERGRTASIPETVRLHVGEIVTLTKDGRGLIEPGTVDLILTDPPYGGETLALHGALGRFAARYLKPGGSLAFMTGQTWLPQVFAELARVEELSYHWTLAYLTPGGQSPQIWPRCVNTFWKPILWYTHGKRTGKWLGDVAKSDENDKRFHGWGQSESGMLDLLLRFSEPGDLVCDPFLGGGTTAMVCAASGRCFVGFDADASAIEVARGRLTEETPNVEG